jgi:Esterase/lipase
MALNPILKDLLAQSKPLPRFNLEEARLAHDERSRNLASTDISIISSIQDQIVKTSIRETPIRVYNPETSGPHPAFFYIHGGGFVYGSAEQWDGFCSKIAKAANCVVINIDYGLAPEHKFPAPLEECYEIIKWAHDNTIELNIDSNKFAVGGDSAGGNISTGLCTLARDRGEFSLVYQVLIYPVLDLSIDPHKRLLNGEIDNDRADVEKWFNDCYLNNPEDGKNYLSSPSLNDNLKDVADALIITGECDPLIVEDIAYAKKLIDSGVNVYIQKFDGMIHGFINMTRILKESVDAQNLVCSQLYRVFNK